MPQFLSLVAVTAHVLLHENMLPSMSKGEKDL